MKLNSRRFFVKQGLALAISACACRAAFAQGSADGKGPYVCPPCGCAMDGHDFEKPGKCPACGMQLVAKTAPSNPAPDVVTFGVDRVQRDFDRLYDNLKHAHYDLFAQVQKPAYDRLHTQMRAGFTTAMTENQIRVAFQTFVAFGRVAHAFVNLPVTSFQSHIAKGGKLFPLSLRMDNGRVFVAANRTGVDALCAGTEIVAVDRVPIGAWLRPMLAQISADTDYLSGTLLESALLLLVWLNLGDRDSFEIGLRTPAGDVTSYTVPARTGAEWDAANSTPSPGIDFMARDTRMLDGGVGYLRPGPFYNSDGPEWDTTAFRDFIDKAFNSFISAGANRLIIDLRGNPGGDGAFSDILVAWIAARPSRMFSQFRLRASAITRDRVNERLKQYESQPQSPVYVETQRMADALAHQADGARFDYPVPQTEPRKGPRFSGKVFVLIDRYAYSNAVAVAAQVQDYSFARILGEATADLPTGFGASESFVLPETGLTVTYPKSRYVRPSGNLAVRGVVPDVILPAPALGATTDTMLTAAMAIALKGVLG